MADERRAIVARAFRGDLVDWIGREPRTALRVMRIVEEVIQTPFHGIGKPEPLRHSPAGHWSRRVTREHRLVYTVAAREIFFLRARDHYTR
jgi:toxin YoeB